MDQKLINKCKRDWSILLREAQERKTSDEIDIDNLAMIDKTQLKQPSHPIFFPVPKQGKAKK